MIIPVRVYGPAQPGTSTGVLATVPTSKRWVIKQIVMANTTNTAATITLGLNGTAAADQVVPEITVQPNTVETLDCSIVLETTETIDGLQGTSAAVTVTINVVEEDV